MVSDDGNGTLPLWVRAADVLTVLLALAALVVVLTGGVRLEMVGVHVSVTSWVRLAVWALLVTAVRHELHPQPPLRRLVRARRLSPNETFAAVFPAVVVPRAAVLLVGLMAVYAFGLPEAAQPLIADPSESTNLFARWDSGWYLHIVRNGYLPSGQIANQQNIAFFPLYPLTMKIVGEALGGRFLVAGFLVSTAAFAGALVYLYRLGTRMCRTAEGPRWGIALLAVYPFAVFFSTVYTESLFLLCAAGAFYHVLRGQRLAAAGWALAAGLTRPNGVLLAVPLALIVVLRMWPALSRRPWIAGAHGLSADGDARLRALDVLVVAAPALGLGIYAAYIWWLTGDPLAWMHAQAGWGRGFEGLEAQALVPDPFVRRGLFRALRISTPDVLNRAAALLALALSWPVTRHYGLPFGVFVALNVLVPMASGGGPVSLGRFTSVLFPMFLYLGDAVPDRHRPYWIAAFAMGQAFIAAMFFAWRPLY